MLESKKVLKTHTHAHTHTHSRTHPWDMAKCQRDTGAYLKSSPGRSQNNLSNKISSIGL